LWSS